MTTIVGSTFVSRTMSQSAVTIHAQVRARAELRIATFHQAATPSTASDVERL
jgi:hypothetical protein